MYQHFIIIPNSEPMQTRTSTKSVEDVRKGGGGDGALHRCHLPFVGSYVLHHPHLESNETTIHSLTHISKLDFLLYLFLRFFFFSPCFARSIGNYIKLPCTHFLCINKWLKMYKIKKANELPEIEIWNIRPLAACILYSPTVNQF